MTIATCEKQVQKEVWSVEQTYSKSRALELCKESTKDDLSAEVIVNKYLLCNNENYYETCPSDMWHRLANAISEAEDEENREKYRTHYRQLLEDWKFVPGGRILYGLGNTFSRVTLKNCYVIAIEDDSIEGIFKTAYRMAETYKRGGGCGIDISTLRPKGSPVCNAARHSSGAVSFMELFSQVTGHIGQCGRIGALMICIDVSHPDIEEFIKIKGGDDLELVENANVSVKMSDEFMQAVQNDLDFDLHWGGKVYKTVKAKKLWEDIIYYAWKRAEPGLLFWDQTCNYTPAHQYKMFRCIATNPCLSGDTRILTETGYHKSYKLWADQGFKEYEEIRVHPKYGSQRIVSRHGVTASTSVFRTSESASLYRVTFDNGSFIDATANHKFIVEGKDRMPLSDLNIGDRVPIQRETSFGDFDYPDYAVLAGWVIGDGSLSRAADSQIRALVRVWDEDIENALPRLQESLTTVYNRSNKSTNQNPAYDPVESNDKGFEYRKKTMKSNVLGRLLSEDGLYAGDKHVIPQSIWSGNLVTISAFLRGLFSADGGVQINERKKNASVRLSQSHEQLLIDCQLLLSQLGIDSDFRHRRKPSKQWINDGRGGKRLYNRKAQYELIIARRDNLVRFIEKVGFIQNWKNEVLSAWLSSHKGSNNSAQATSLTIKSIGYVGEEETFCLTEPEFHEMTVSGIRIAQCGEVPLSHGDSCNLGSVNLSKYVIKPFRSPSFDYRSFVSDTKMAVRFLDNIISLEKAPLEFQQRANDQGRRLGLGIMGLADMFLKMNIKFDSDQALTMAGEVFEKFQNASYDASCDLAMERGPFPEFDASKHLSSPFIQGLPTRIQDRISSVGIRNVSINAIAPTGSLSIIAQCSSGIEPVFQVEHIRKTKLGKSREEKEHKIYHKAASEYMEEMGRSELPDFFVEAHNIDPTYRVRLQSLIQGKIDQSISNTVNLPEDTSKERIGYYYMEAWKAGCKGITVYREGSREGILISKNKSGEIDVHQAPKRPKELEADVHVIKPNGKTYTVFVGLLKGRVYEVFALDHKQVGIADGIKGKIVRAIDEQPDSHNVYNFISGPMTISMLNRYEDTDASLITRLLSTSLRHGTPLEFAIDQITKSKVPMHSFARAIARALSKYIKQEEVKGKFKCPKCGSRNVKFEGTCRSCFECGESSCS